MKTHRCKESLANQVSIRKYEIADETKVGTSDDKGYLLSRVGLGDKWVFGELRMDSEYDCIYMDYMYLAISYCPFCGEKLE